MIGVSNLVGACGAVAGNVLLGAVMSAIPSPGWCPYVACRGGHSTVIVVEQRNPWLPFVDNPWGGIKPAPAAETPECARGARSETPAVLIDAPLPGRLDLVGASRSLFACVRVSSDGNATAAYLTRGTGDARLDRALLAAIRSDWRFQAYYRGEPDPGWQRIRLKSEWP